MAEILHLGCLISLQIEKLPINLLQDFFHQK